LREVDFYSDPTKQSQWAGFLNVNALKGRVPETNFEKVIVRLRSFIIPVLEAIKNNDNFEAKWIPAKEWLT